MAEFIFWSGLIVQIALAAAVVLWFQQRLTGALGFADREVRETLVRLQDLSAQVAVDVREHAAIVKRLNGELDVLKQLPDQSAAAPERSLLITQISSTIEALRDKLQASERKLDHETQSLNSVAVRPDNDGQPAMKLTAAEAREVSESLGREIYSGPDRRRHPRQIMLKTIRVAPSVETLATANFSEVQCFDISIGGISFFLPHETKERSFVVGLGPIESAIYVRARVVRVVPTKLHTHPMYLIGCEFTDRIGRADLPPPNEGRRGLAFQTSGASAGR